MDKKDWTYRKLGEVCEVQNGLWTGKKPPFVKVGVIRNTNFTKDCTLDDNDIFFTDVEEKAYKKRKLLKGDIIIEKSGGSEKQPVGRPILFDLDGEYSFSNFTSVLRLNTNELTPSFLHKALVGLYFQGKTRPLQSKTTGIHNLDFNKFLQFSIPIPLLPTQQRIVAELDCISTILEKKRQQLKELDNLAQAIFYEMFGDPVENEKGWEVKKLGEECLEIRYGTSKPAVENGKYGYLRMGNLTSSGHLDLSDLKTIDIPDDEIEKCIVRKGDILFNRTNSLELIGKTCMFDLEEPMVIAGYIIRVRLKSTLHPRFVAVLFNLPSMKKTLRKMAKGAVNQANINSKELASIPIILPPLSLQQSFAAKIEAIEKQKERISQSIKEVQTLFDSRMQEYFG